MDPTYNYQYSGDVPAAAAGGAALFAGGIFLFVMLFVLAIYVVMAISLMKIATRTNTPNGWFAWIPILNLVLMLQIAETADVVAGFFSSADHQHRGNCPLFRDLGGYREKAR